jgi:hypothetical protein
MPELYTFVTERTFNLEAVEEIIAGLTAEGIVFYVHQLDKGCFISGYNWEEDCGYPPELTMIFDKSGVTCTYCNNNEYGIIQGESDTLFFNTSLPTVKHYKQP